MSIQVWSSDAPARVLAAAAEALETDPVANNLVLTILHARIAQPVAGRYWVAEREDRIVGLVLQSPLSNAATLSRMEPEVASALAEAVATGDIALPGLNGDVRSAAAFAGRWVETARAGIKPVLALRIAEVVGVNSEMKAGGRLRQAGGDDRELLVAWMRAFLADIGETRGDVEAEVDTRLAAGRMWLWEDGATACMAATSAPVAGVARIQAVYTDRAARNRGYAEACTGQLARQVLAAGLRCILYVDLGNPAAVCAYARVGFRPVADVLRYDFA